MDVDQALHQVGTYGRLQRRVLWSMAVPQAFVAWHHIQNAFTGAEPQLYCVRADKQSEGCPKTGEIECDSYIFPSTDFTSIASEWNLVCGDAYKSDLVQSVYMAGLLLGNLVGGAVADQYGRRRLVWMSPLAISVFSLLAAAAGSYESYMILRFLAAVSTGAYGLVSFTLPAELVGAEHRGFVNVLTTVSYALGIGTLSVVAFLVRDWRAVSVITALPGLIGLYYYKYVPESPRWLLSQGRVEEAQEVLMHIAYVNSGDHPPIQPIKLHLVPAATTTRGQGSIADLIRHPVLRWITAINVYTWLVVAAVYYGLTLRAGTLGTNRYVSVSLAGLVEIPADFVTLWSMDRYGRRITYSLSLLTGGICCLAIVAVPQGFTNCSTLLAFMGKIGISMGFCVCWMHAAEMYPTSIRNKALSVCNMASRVGGVVSPLILTLGKLHNNCDFFIFGVFTILAGLASRALPETRNRPMPETIDDIDSHRSTNQTLLTKVIGIPVVSEKVRLLEDEIDKLERVRQSDS